MSLDRFLRISFLSRARFDRWDIFIFSQWSLVGETSRLSPFVKKKKKNIRHHAIMGRLGNTFIINIFFLSFYLFSNFSF